MLDLDETLIHFVNNQKEQERKQMEDQNDSCSVRDDVSNSTDAFYYMVRPHCNKFLKTLSEFFEIVIFTAAMQDYADWILDGIY